MTDMTANIIDNHSCNCYKILIYTNDIWTLSVCISLFRNDININTYIEQILILMIRFISNANVFCEIYRLKSFP